MGEQYEVRLTRHAQCQMLEIAQYISAVLQAPETAKKWLDTMEREMDSLSFMPARIPFTEEEPWRSQGIHKMTVKNFFVYFWIEKVKFRVWITAVIYARRSQKRQLELMEMP